MTLKPIPTLDRAADGSRGTRKHVEHAVRIPVGDGGDELALRLARPGRVAPAATDLAVLYFHGFGSAQDGEKATYFRARFLDAGIAMASIDFRGHGDSGGTLFDLSLSRNLEDIALARRAVFDAGYRRLILFGSSVGGASALWHAVDEIEHQASRHGDRGTVVGAIHIAPALDLRAQLETSLGPDGIARWRREGSMLLPHEKTPAEIAWTMMEDLEGYRAQDLAARYQVPSLIFQGTDDTSVSWRAVLDFVDACAAPIELHLISDGDHRLVDRLDHLWRLALSFLVARGILDPAEVGGTR